MFPVGPGRIETSDTDPASSASRCRTRPVTRRGTGDFAITPARIQPCKTWWTDPETGAKSPVFAGLPFMSLYGNYAIHGPIDNFRAPNGGTLRRGFVSHGCFRMEAADVLEVYARIKGVAQACRCTCSASPSALADGTQRRRRQKWIGAAVLADTRLQLRRRLLRDQRAHAAAASAARAARRPAPIAPGYPATFCVADPDARRLGMCVPQAQLDQDFACRPYADMTAQTVPRFNQPAVSAKVCLPHATGWIGDACAADGDCDAGLSCGGAGALAPGVCTQACTAICPDQPGWSETTCVTARAIADAGTCLRRCTPSTNASECGAGQDCVPEARAALPSQTRYVCMPHAAATN